MIILFFILYILCTVSGLTLFKLGSKSLVVNLTHGAFNIAFNWQVIFGMLLYITSFLLWLYIVSKTNLSLAFPIAVGIVNVLVMISSVTIIGETVTILQGLGALIVFLGIVLIGIGSK